MSYLSVEYLSYWEEGIVATKAVLNLDTGEVFDIETSDDGEDFEFHKHDTISYEDFECDVVDDSTEFEYCISKEDLEKLVEKLLETYGNIK